MLVQPTFQMRFLNFRNILGENLQSAFRVNIEMLVWRIHEFNVRAQNCIPSTPCTKLDKPKEKYEEIRIGRTQTKWEMIKIMCNVMDNKGSHPLRKVQFFLTLFERPLTWPPPLSFEHYVVNFSEGILTSVRKRLARQLSTK